MVDPGGNGDGVNGVGMPNVLPDPSTLPDESPGEDDEDISSWSDDLSSSDDPNDSGLLFSQSLVTAGFKRKPLHEQPSQALDQEQQDWRLTPDDPDGYSAANPDVAKYNQSIPTLDPLHYQSAAFGYGRLLQPSVMTANDVKASIDTAQKMPGQERGDDAHLVQSTPAAQAEVRTLKVVSTLDPDLSERPNAVKRVEKVEIIDPDA